MKTREIKVTSGNRITVPWDIRKDIDWFKEGQKLKVSLVGDDTIVIKPIRAKPLKIVTRPKKKRNAAKIALVSLIHRRKKAKS